MTTGSTLGAADAVVTLLQLGNLRPVGPNSGTSCPADQAYHPENLDVL